MRILKKKNRRNRYIFRLAGIVLFFFYSCNSKPANTVATKKSIPIKPLIIKNGPEDGYGADIRLSISRTEETDTSTIYKLESIYEGNPIGLEIRVPKIRKGKIISAFVVFKSDGHPSDRLLHLLANLYHQPIDSSAKFISSVSAVFVNLQDYGNKLKDSTGNDYTIPYQYKLFFDAENEQGDDAEMFLDINPGEGWVDLAEKDEDYRPKLIGLFKQH